MQVPRAVADLVYRGGHVPDQVLSHFITKIDKLSWKDSLLVQEGKRAYCPLCGRLREPGTSCDCQLPEWEWQYPNEPTAKKAAKKAWDAAARKGIIPPGTNPREINTIYKDCPPNYVVTMHCTEDFYVASNLTYEPKSDNFARNNRHLRTPGQKK